MSDVKAPFFLRAPEGLQRLQERSWDPEVKGSHKGSIRVPIRVPIRVSLKGAFKGGASKGSYKIHELQVARAKASADKPSSSTPTVPQPSAALNYKPPLTHFLNPKPHPSLEGNNVQ